MHRRPSTFNWRRELSIIFALLFAALIIAGQFSHSHRPFTSAEVKFTDASAHGLSIMPASCPSDPHFAGDCTNPRPATCSVTLTPYSVTQGNSSSISWRVNLNSSAVWTNIYSDGRIDPDIGPVGQSGSDTVTPLQTTTYVLTAHTCSTFGASASGSCVPGAQLNTVQCQATLSVTPSTGGCTPGAHQHVQSGMCVCDNGYTWNSTTAQCQLQCPPDTVQVGDQCVKCPDGTQLIGGQCVLMCTTDPFTGQCTCPTGTHQVGNQCIKCPDGTTYQNGQCVAKCPVGSIEYQGQCITCQPGQVFSGGQCLDHCPAGTVQQGKLCISNDCPIGYTKDANGNCVFTECPAGYVRQGDSCIQTECPIGYVRQSDGTCAFDQCPAGYVQAGTTCVQSRCPTPFFYCGRGADANTLYERSYGAAPACTAQDGVYAVCDNGCDATAGSCRGVASSGNLDARPLLVRQGDRSVVSWQVYGATSCTVSAPNGDSWSCTTTACGTRTSQPTLPLTVQTTYTLNCTMSARSVAAGGPATLTKSVTINIIPVFQEH